MGKKELYQQSLNKLQTALTDVGDVVYSETNNSSAVKEITYDQMKFHLSHGETIAFYSSGRISITNKQGIVNWI